MKHGSSTKSLYVALAESESFRETGFAWEKIGPTHGVVYATTIPAHCHEVSQGGETWFFESYSGAADVATGPVDGEAVDWTFTRVQPGQFLHIPAGHAHAATLCNNSTPMQFLFVLETDDSREQRRFLQEPW